jgi:hypothetical protein
MRSLAHQICAFRDFPRGRFHLVPQLRHARFRLGIEIKIPGDFAEFWLRPLEAFDRVVVPFGLLNSFVLFALTHWFRSAFQTSPLSIVQRSVFRSGPGDAIREREGRAAAFSSQAKGISCCHFPADGSNRWIG